MAVMVEPIWLPTLSMAARFFTLPVFCNFRMVVQSYILPQQRIISFPLLWKLLWSGIWKVSTYHQTKEDIEQELEVIRLAQKDPRYFAPIYEKYYEQIFVFIYKRVDDEDATGDITSMVFMKCLKNLEKYKFQGVPFSAWLYRIAVNEVNQYFRMEKKRERTVNLRTEHIGFLFEEMDISEGTKEPEEIIAELLQVLKPDDLQFIELRFFEARSFKEIGYFLNISEVNAKVKTYRILKKLRIKAGELGLLR